MLNWSGEREQARLRAVARVAPRPEARALNPHPDTVMEPCVKVIAFLFAAASPVLAAAFLAAPALADDYIGFRSPTGNIHCAIYEWNGGAEARCDLRELTPSYTRAPAGCDLDWGNSFAVGATGKGVLACVGDTVMDPGNWVLDYGQAASLGGISCVSAKTGITCTNAEGHGFSVAKARQKLF
jgi:hypothetical protein